MATKKPKILPDFAWRAQEAGAPLSAWERHGGFRWQWSWWSSPGPDISQVKLPMKSMPHVPCPNNWLPNHQMPTLDFFFFIVLNYFKLWDFKVITSGFLACLWELTLEVNMISHSSYPSLAKNHQFAAKPRHIAGADWRTELVPEVVLKATSFPSFFSNLNPGGPSRPCQL